jgi:hypothetical protein
VNDDRISRHLHAQADAIDLPPADPAAAMRRGQRRRTRRRVGLAGAVAVAGVLATTVAVRDTGGRHQELQLGSASSTSASSFEWSVVDPRVGLGYDWFSGGVAALADGSVYSISTAPGSHTADGPVAQALYRSTDGAEWDKRSLPSGTKTHDLAGAGETLYGIGTAPSGGLVVSASDDGAATWSTAAQLPDDLLALQARHPGLVSLSTPRIAARDRSHVVVAITASANLDLTKLGHPEYATGEHLTRVGPDGIDVFTVPTSDCSADVDVSAGGGPRTDPAATDPATAEDENRCAARAAGTKEAALQTPAASFTFDELGITGELRELVGGKPFVYASDDGTAFERSELVDELPTSTGTRDVQPLATPDGFRLFVSGYSEHGSHALVFRSADGHGWAADGGFDGGVSGVGLVGDLPAAAVWKDQGGASLELQGAGGWTSVDLAHLLSVPQGTEAYVESVAFGPLGVAAVLGVADEEGEHDQQYVLHSADGSRFQVEQVEQHVDNGGVVTGVSVTADAIAVRVTTPDDGDPRTPPTQQVLVGTPR